MPTFFPRKSSGARIGDAAAKKIYGWMNMRIGKIGIAITGSPRSRAIVYHESDISAISNCSYTGTRQASPGTAGRNWKLMPSAFTAPVRSGRVKAEGINFEFQIVRAHV